jgi:hypothetical protein
VLSEATLQTFPKTYSCCVQSLILTFDHAAEGR